MVAIDVKAPDKLQAWLENWPREANQAIAVRCSLRVIPLVLGIVRPRRGNISIQQIGNLIPQVFRCNIISLSACRDRMFDFGFAAAAAAAAAAASEARLLASSPPRDSTDYAAAAASARSAAATIGVLDRVSGSARAAASAAVRAAGSADGAAAGKEMWSAIEADCRWLEENGDGLIDCPIWPSDTWGDPTLDVNSPPWVRIALDEFAVSDRAKSAFGRIANWHRAILYMGTKGAPESLSGGHSDIEIAIMPDEFWTVSPDRTATMIMDEVANIGGWGRKETVRESEQTMRDFILKMLDESGQPLSIADVVARFGAAGYTSRDYSIRGRLNELVGEGKIQRVERG